MAVSVTLTKIDRRPDGQIWVTWSDGSTNYFNSADVVKQQGAELDSRQDVAQAMLLRWWVARSADLGNVNLVVGKTLTFDLSAAAPIKVQ